jgi:hypothetical protein
MWHQLHTPHLAFAHSGTLSKMQVVCVAKTFCSISVRTVRHVDETTQDLKFESRTLSPKSAIQITTLNPGFRVPDPGFIGGLSPGLRTRCPGFKFKVLGDFVNVSNGSHLDDVPKCTKHQSDVHNWCHIARRQPITHPLNYVVSHRTLNSDATEGIRYNYDHIRETTEHVP